MRVTIHRKNDLAVRALLHQNSALRQLLQVE
jgi:hypothetical protein